MMNFRFYQVTMMMMMVHWLQAAKLVQSMYENCCNPRVPPQHSSELSQQSHLREENGPEESSEQSLVKCFCTGLYECCTNLMFGWVDIHINM